MNPSPYELRPDLPPELDDLRLLALDLRWSWNHVADRLWQCVDEGLWRHTHNPWLILQTVSLQRLKTLANDKDFRRLLQNLREEQNNTLQADTWFSHAHADNTLRPSAYFCMEYGISEALPLYSGGLGVLAGDYLKTCSELGVPLQAIGLLYQQGYFRQALDSDGNQLAFYPFNDPTQIPVVPVRTEEGEWLRIAIPLPGRKLRLRAWQAQVGRVVLYLLDSNDPLNGPADRGITSELYGGGSERRLQQELVLGIGGYRLLHALRQEPEICHLNEGHAAFSILERAKTHMEKEAVNFQTALTATRSGNLFTTHTPVEAGFDRFSTTLLTDYLQPWADEADIPIAELLALGRSRPDAVDEAFNMAWLAIHGSNAVNGVSRLHGKVSRHMFRSLFPRWPETEVPIRSVTNGVHVSSWDSPESDRLWTEICGKERWREDLQTISEAVQKVTDTDLWEMRARNRHHLVEWIQNKHTQCLSQPQGTGIALDPNALTLGFARRFATYKRPNLLLQDKHRLARLLTQTDRPVQLVIAGKAHPQDRDGQALIREWIHFINDFQLQQHIVFLVDYDLLIAGHLIEGVDVWINTPRRPWEACGTSGMKVLVNGGLNLSELDGWWAEAWRPEVGWALGDGQEHDADPGWDYQEAQSLYDCLEQQVIPEFYQRDAHGVPEAWIRRMRSSMAELTPAYSSNRMVREYVEEYYLPMARQFRKRCSQNSTGAKDIVAWKQKLKQHWQAIHFGDIQIISNEKFFYFQLPLYLDDLDPSMVRVELYADPVEGEQAEIHPFRRVEKLAGAVNGYLYEVSIAIQRPVSDYTARVLPQHADVQVPIETNLILWQR
ncbi:alpha-glucan family phosphorylase [Thiolapillus sp.]